MRMPGGDEEWSWGTHGLKVDRLFAFMVRSIWAEDVGLAER